MTHNNNNNKTQTLFSLFFFLNVFRCLKWFLWLSFFHCLATCSTFQITFNRFAWPFLGYFKCVRCFFFFRYGWSSFFFPDDDKIATNYETRIISGQADIFFFSSSNGKVFNDFEINETFELKSNQNKSIRVGEIESNRIRWSIL